MHLLVACIALVTFKPGTTIFIEGGRLSPVIEKVTGSNLTHTAIILYDGDTPWVYEATFPRVKRTKLKQWQSEQAVRSAIHNSRVLYIEPKSDYASEQLQDMKIYADGQLGRKYKLRGYWKNRPVNGVFCSQYIADVLSASGRIESHHSKETPVSLFMKCRDL